MDKEGPKLENSEHM